MALKGRSAVRIVAIAVLVCVLGWHYWRTHRTVPVTAAGASTAASASSAPAVASTAAVAVKPASPKTWKLGSLTLTSCEIGGNAHGGRGASVKAWCGKFDVPENRADPHGRHIKLNLAVVRAAADVPDKDIVVLLAGGPGEAATTAAHMATAFPGLHKRHDFLLLDQRGTGHSNPLDCKAEASATATTLNPERLRKSVAACLAQVRKKGDPRYYTTTVAVEDLEDVRKALGSPQFDLIGVSYGTRMAQQYLMRHPAGVRSMVLDSIVPNQVVLGEDFAVNLQSALNRDFALCTATPACKQRFGDPMQTLHQLRDALRATPHKVSARNPWSFDAGDRVLSQYTLARVVRLFAYSPQTAALLPLAIDAAAHGDVGPLLGQYALISGDLSGKVSNGMNWSVICSEDADLLKPRPQDADTILGDSLLKSYQAICSVWPHGTRPADFHAPLKSDKPILLLSGALDPVTPPGYGKLILPGLTDARQLILKGQGHGVEMIGCMPQLIGKFIDTLQPEKLDAHCLDKLGPTPAFLTFNGAAP